MAFTPTKEQKEAIYSDGSILVSAAAGSGKTAVLVERVANLLVNSVPRISADKLLIVTFTNAAAAELRSRIDKRLAEEFDSRPEDSEIQMQRILLNNAKICTIDSFCLDFIKENFEYSGINPSFKIAEGSSVKVMEKQAMSALINECFEKGEERFYNILDFFGGNFDDSQLTDCIYDLFNFSRNMPYPTLWLDNIVKDYSEFASGKSDKFVAEGLNIVADIFENALEYANKSVEILKTDPVCFNKWGLNFTYFSEVSSSLLAFAKSGEWDACRLTAKTIKPPALKRFPDELKTDNILLALEYRDMAKELIKSSLSVLSDNLADLRKETEYISLHLSYLVELVKEYEKKLYGLFDEQNLITFYKSEQTVLQLLTELNGNAILPSDLAKYYSEQFDAILVDEYQDTNTLQDMIFDILSDGGKKLFCVGDAKQSIYKFRGANPLNFIAKKDVAVPSKDRMPDEALRIDLKCNFRSRADICEYANRLFEKLMSRKNALIEYDESEKLSPEAVFPQCEEPAADTHFVDYVALSSDEDLNTDSATEVEAHKVADLIFEAMEKPAFIRTDDKKGLRKAKYSDFTILVRAMKGKGTTYIKTLRDRGIPVTASVSDTIDSDEVNTLISFLKIINNPSDDIALLTVLTSSVFMFTMNEIATLRTHNRYKSIYSSMIRASENGDTKATEFIELLSGLRKISVTSSLGELIEEIFDQTNLLNVFSAGGEDTARMNLLSVQSFAESFEQDRKRDIRSFISYFEQLDNRDFKLTAESSNCVTVMTIHSSKGLQFPICIVAGCGNDFYFPDLRSRYYIDESHGISFSYYLDDEKQDGNLLRTLMKKDMEKQLLAEEMRLLYVALTRAVDKLIVMVTYRDMYKKLPKIVDATNKSLCCDTISSVLYSQCKSYADWLVAAFSLSGNTAHLIAHKNSNNIFFHKSVGSAETSEITEEIYPNDTVINELKGFYAIKYPYQDILDVESKASVTDLVHKADTDKYRFISRPAFLNSGGLTSAEKGTAVHKIMQYADFNRCKGDLDSELERLYENFYLSDAEYESVDKEILNSFFTSDLCYRILSSQSVRREYKFLTEFPATQLKEDLNAKYSDEMIVVQGAVDLVFEENDRLVIVDFKTDSNKDENAFISAYSQQLKLYSKACEKLLKKPIGELILYSFSLQKEIIIK